LQGIETWSDLESWQPSVIELKILARKIRRRFASTTAAKKAKENEDDWLAHSIYFIRDALWFCEFEDGIRFADAGRVMRILKYWVLAYRGSGQHNYARECAEVILKWRYETTPVMRSMLERSWFINRFGIEGRAIPCDLWLEQNNCKVKVCLLHRAAHLALTILQQTHISYGNGVTIKYIQDKGSACVEALDEIGHLVARYFGDPDRSRRSKEIAFHDDLQTLVGEMLTPAHNPHITSPGRVIYPPSSTSTGKKAAKSQQSAITDVLELGAEVWQAKFKEFIQSTSYDPALGYPITMSENDGPRNLCLDTGTVFDDLDRNPLDASRHEDLFGDEEDGIDSLGGGGEYHTGHMNDIE
jgi:hypothetical protein